MRVESDHVLSLFAGAGGFSYGFSQAGLKPICGAEIDKDACATYEANVGSTCHRLDLSDVSPSFFLQALNGKSPFAVIGGPPCQGFSTAGTRNADDPRNKLIFNYLHIVEEIRPRWFIFENVEGLLTSGHGESISALVREFLRIGYSVRLQKVNFAAFGVPQTRKRLLIIGNRIGASFQFPEETHSFNSGKSKKASSLKFSPTLFEALAGLGEPVSSRNALSPYQSSEPINDFDRYMRQDNIDSGVSDHFQLVAAKDIDLFSRLRPGQSMKDLPEELWHDSFRRRAFRRVMDGTPSDKRGGAPSGIKRLHGDLQSLTITGAASREFIHPTENRPLTMRECARLQTFPDKYRFYGNAASASQQIGNAVPPLVASVFAKYLQHIDGSFGARLTSSDVIPLPRFLGFVLTDSIGMSPALKNTEYLLTRLLQKELEFS